MEGDRSATQTLRRNARAEHSRDIPADSHDTMSVTAASQ
jgi:hypothetical protein